METTAKNENDEMVKIQFKMADTPGEIAEAHNEKVQKQVEMADTPGEIAETPGEIAEIPGEISETSGEIAGSSVQQITRPSQIFSGFWSKWLNFIKVS